MTLIEGGIGRQTTSFEPSILLGRDPVAVTQAVEEVARSLAGRQVGDASLVTRVGLLACEMHGAQASFLPIGKERVLDWAAELLAVADMLRSQDASMEALALEGVQGRLLEALMGAGPMLASVPPESAGGGRHREAAGDALTPSRAPAHGTTQDGPRRGRCRYRRDDTAKGR